MTKRCMRALDLCAAIATAALVAAVVVSSRADEGSPAIDIGDSDLGGVVTGPAGPEAGVWVIAETSDLPTKFAKVVVTDDRGRYLVPDLPKANYSLWVRGYGLVDSTKVQSTPGKPVNLTAVPAPTAAAAAEYYPGVYWYALLKIPAASEFPGTGTNGNAIGELVKTQHAWIDTIKNSCQSCHALGSKGVRTLSKELGEFSNSTEAWARHLQSGQAMTNMFATLSRLGPNKALRCSRTGPTALPPGNCPSPNRTDRRGSSAMS